jgi:hypothetical protein
LYYVAGEWGCADAEGGGALIAKKCRMRLIYPMKGKLTACPCSRGHKSQTQ